VCSRWTDEIRAQSHRDARDHSQRFVEKPERTGSGMQRSLRNCAIWTVAHLLSLETTRQFWPRWVRISALGPTSGSKTLCVGSCLVLERLLMTSRRNIALPANSTNPSGQPGVERRAPLQEKTVQISDLRFGQSPRLMPEDVDHAKMLAELKEVLPPILVHAETMEVIDGWHRVLAARFRGETSIRARLFHGTSEDAFFLGVRSNIAHGKPLTLAERHVAASRILKLRPDLSDRTIARTCGLSPTTIGAHRKAGPTGDLAERVGEDGRTRRLSSQQVRRQAAELMLAFPDESNRSIGRSVGLSEATVRSVRHQSNAATPSAAGRRKLAGPSSDGPGRSDKPEPGDIPAPKESAEHGSRFASWLMAHSVSETSWADLLADIPLSQCAGLIVDARAIADSWQALAGRLERRMTEESGS
jgi:ParB-like chromosome segregation protein Spo0J